MFVKGKVLGEGMYGKVYSAKTPDNEEVVVKRNFIENTSDFIGNIRELDILTCMDHPNIVKLKSVSFEDPFSKKLSPMKKKKQKHSKTDGVYFVMEKGICDLENAMSGKNLSIAQYKLYMVDLLLAVEYMHLRGIFHGDIKPGNCLIFPDKIKICDFGFANYLNNQNVYMPSVQTWEYKAPESSLEMIYDEKIDVWSLGCMFYEMIAKEDFLQRKDSSVHYHISTILKKLPDFVDFRKLGNYSKQMRLFKVNRVDSTKSKRQTWKDRLVSREEEFNSTPGNLDDFCDLLQGMICFLKEKRFSATDCLNHKCFDPVRDYINKSRHAPVTAPTPRVIQFKECKIRDNMIKLALYIFSQRENIEWWKPEILFHAIDLFDRYLLLSTGGQMTCTEMYLKFNACLYIFLKYFSCMEIIPEYKEIFKDVWNAEECRKEVFDFEKEIIVSFRGNIFKHTLYEYKRPLSDHEMYKLLNLLQTRNDTPFDTVWNMMI